MRPASGDYAPYFERYISLVHGDDVMPVLAAQPAQLRAALQGVTGEAAGYRYAPDKWSVREVIGHVIDTERVMAFRAFWFARESSESLPGFDQEPFAAAAKHDAPRLGELIDEFCCVRESHLWMLRHLDASAWERSGVASGHKLSVRAAAFIMAGHLPYHARILGEQYRLSGFA